MEVREAVRMSSAAVQLQEGPESGPTHLNERDVPLHKSGRMGYTPFPNAVSARRYAAFTASSKSAMPRDCNWLGARGQGLGLGSGLEADLHCRPARRAAAVDSIRAL